MILVIGGRSKIGSTLIELLRARGEEVRALVRAQEAEPCSRRASSRSWAIWGDPGSLRAAMTGVPKVFLLSSPHRDAVPWHRNAIDAARESGVGLEVRSSILGANLDSPAEFVNAHTECDRYIEQSGLEYVIVRPNLFLQNVPESDLPWTVPMGTCTSMRATPGSAWSIRVTCRPVTQRSLPPSGTAVGFQLRGDAEVRRGVL